MAIHLSLADIPESALVERLMGDARWRRRLIGIKGIDPAVSSYLRVPMTDLPGDPKGDVDVLLALPTQPELATAVEAKRIKVGPGAFRKGGRPNKLDKLRKAVQQANLLASIGLLAFSMRKEKSATVFLLSPLPIALPTRCCLEFRRWPTMWRGAPWSARSMRFLRIF